VEEVLGDGLDTRKRICQRLAQRITQQEHLLGRIAGPVLMDANSSFFMPIKVRTRDRRKPSSTVFTSIPLNPFRVIFSPKSSVSNDKFWGSTNKIGACSFHAEVLARKEALFKMVRFYNP
jgi:hypothetical protein